MNCGVCSAVSVDLTYVQELQDNCVYIKCCHSVGNAFKGVIQLQICTFKNRKTRVTTLNMKDEVRFDFEVRVDYT